MIAKAARKDSKPPSPTEDQAKQEQKAAEQALGVLEADYEVAVSELHRTLIGHLREAIDAQQPAVFALRNTGRELTNQLAGVMEKLDRETSVLGTLASIDEHTVTGRGKARYLRIGKVSFDKPRKVDADLQVRKLIPLLRAAIEAYGREVTETVGETQERERREAEAGSRIQRAGDGVFVPTEVG